MRCWPNLNPVESVGELGRLDRMDANFAGRSGAGARPTPITVPPVPTPATNASRRRPRPRQAARRISGPVVASCAIGIGGVRELRGQETRVGLLAAISSARAMHAEEAPLPAWLTRMMCAPKLAMRSRRSRLIQSGMKIVTG